MEKSNCQIGQTWPDVHPCTKCGIPTDHLLFGKELKGEKEKITLACLVCKSKRTLKPAVTKLKISVRKEELFSKEQLFSTWTTEVEGKSGCLFSMTDSYQSGEIVVHPKFGSMKCTEIHHEGGKATFLTSEGLKVFKVAN